MDRSNCAEEDVLQKRQLNTFGDNLSQEESEKLITFLTTPYIAIPLLLQAGDLFDLGRISWSCFVMPAVPEPGPRGRAAEQHAAGRARERAL